MPVAVRKKPKPNTGEQLELALVGGSAVPRPARSGEAARASEPAEAASSTVTPEPGPAAPVISSAAARQGPGRPRKVPTALALPPGLKARGSRRKGPPAFP